MIDSAPGSYALWSYGLAAAAYLALAGRLAVQWRASARLGRLVATAFESALWATSVVTFLLWPSTASWWTSLALDTARYALWFAFVWAILRSGQPAGAAQPLSKWFVALVAAAGLASIAMPDLLAFSRDLRSHAYDWTYAARLGLAIAGLLVVEQLLRRVEPDARWAVRPLCIALAGMFAFDLWLYADALLLGRLDPDMWAARGLANALVVPLIAIATARNRRWTIEMRMSRQVVYHSTALLVSAGFLLAVAMVGFLLRHVGGEWTRALHIFMFFAAVVVVVFVASSGGFRAKLKVFVSKHFFSYRYDYRQEWLRFTRSLAGEPSLHGVQQRTIMALADLVESPGGSVWLVHDGVFRPASRCNMPGIDAVVASESLFTTFLARTGWIIDLHERAAHPDRYPGLAIPDWLESSASAWLVVPLVSGTGLTGFVVLLDPRTPFEVDWEVLDVLKTASRQAASYMGYVSATESLLESRKFDAFNRMSAFVVHDLRNLVAQLSLMLKNAERHRDNPDFQRDMLATVDHVVGRMYKLMLQLRTGSEPSDKPRVVDLEAIVRRVCAAKSGAAAIDLELTPGTTTLGHEDRLDHVIGHIVQNALEATAEGGTVTVRTRRDGAHVVIEVIDTGVGMTAEFVRDRLFKPFDTTKSGGMGIGVYESAQYISALGGRIEVDSEPGAGTRMCIRLPAADSAVTRSMAKVVA